MSIFFSWKPTNVSPKFANQVTVTTSHGVTADLASPISVSTDGIISFSVRKAGKYTITSKVVSASESITTEINSAYNSEAAPTNLNGMDVRAVFTDTGDEQRPSTYGVVLWVGGTTQPKNLRSGDIWFSSTTTPSAPPVIHEYSVFGLNAQPNETKLYNDGKSVKVATGFYTLAGAEGWKCAGGRLFVPSNIDVQSTSATFYLWKTLNPSLNSDTPTATATMTNILPGGWNEVRWNAPVTINPGEYFWIGYVFDNFNYVASSSSSDSYVLSSMTDYLVQADGDSFVQGTEIKRSRFAYADGDGVTHITPTFFGIDAIVQSV